MIRACDKVLSGLELSAEVKTHIKEDIRIAEDELDDNAESIISNERYVYIATVIKRCYKKHSAGK